MTYSKINWDKVYNDFSVNKKYIWLNNCGTTPPCTEITKRVKEFLDDYSLNCILTEKFSYNQIKNSIQGILAELLNCDKNDIAIIHNTAEGMNFISYGLNMKKGDEILLLENEYPSNIYPWEHWASKGILLKTVPLGVTQKEFLESFERMITKNTRAAAISAVHWCTGMPLPLKEISEICRNNNTELIIDAAQGAGHIKIDMHEMKLDYLCFSAWKWLLGPLGLAILVISKEKLKKLKYIFKGSDSVKNAENYFPYRNDLKNSAERYMYSSPNFNDWVYFNAALKYLKNIGFANVQKRIFSLAGSFRDKIHLLGFKTVYNPGEGPESGIVVIEKENVNFKLLSGRLSGFGIIAKERLGRLRIAPHIYNSFEQLEQTAEKIESLA